MGTPCPYARSYGPAYRLVNVSFGAAGVRWRVAMAISAVMPGLYVGLYTFFPESPRWLVMRGRHAR